MTGLDRSHLTPAQRAVLDAWPAFEAAAAVKWATVDKVVRTLCNAHSLAELDEREAIELAALLRRGTARLHTLASLRMATAGAATRGRE
ncbi:hypothetical protein SAMN02982917_4092 [Azospirillum oryzae]|uniref:Uncharacterized protein n=1 Tax=Azospirillum oryzae TaxID=286727 RepID=A0A1X7GMW3_9PROT|nr:hypothetical protein [Azospirillum oryzae]SMF72174.1 hypothetical protein SAMN02982917_4092 [Azospirillum oryzae]